MSYLSKFSSPIFTDVPKMCLAYALTVAYSPNFSLPKLLPVWFTKIFPCQIFPVYSIFSIQIFFCDKYQIFEYFFGIIMNLSSFYDVFNMQCYYNREIK